MKKIFVLACLVHLLLVSACTLEASFNSGGHSSKLTVQVNGDNFDGSISEGGVLSIKIIGEDHDGISSIKLTIPAIGMDQEFVNSANTEHWEINQTFDVTSIDYESDREIYVTLTDDTGDVFIRTLRLEINE